MIPLLVVILIIDKISLPSHGGMTMGRGFFVNFSFIDLSGDVSFLDWTGYRTFVIILHVPNGNGSSTSMMVSFLTSWWCVADEAWTALSRKRALQWAVWRVAWDGRVQAPLFSWQTCCVIWSPGFLAMLCCGGSMFLFMLKMKSGWKWADWCLL